MMREAVRRLAIWRHGAADLPQNGSSPSPRPRALIIVENSPVPGDPRVCTRRFRCGVAAGT